MIPCTSTVIILSSCLQRRIYYFDFLVFFKKINWSKLPSFEERLNLSAVLGKKGFSTAFKLYDICMS